MSNKFKIIGVIAFLLLILSINSTYSKLNITFSKSAVFATKSYEAMTISNTTQLDTNSYQITLVNNNDYDISFACEDINSNFSITCSENKIGANTTKNILVYLDFKTDTNTDILTHNPSGDGYITKLGIRITSPYTYKNSSFNYSKSDNMVVVNLPITNLRDYILNLTDTTNLAKDHTTNTRYIGASPNNYVLFNGEVWRILGVFDGVVKIIRTIPYNNTFYTFYDGSASGVNTEFKNAMIRSELNTIFYNSINSNYKNMIKSSVWNTGGINTWNFQAAKTTYDTEKSDVVVANVGLISATDFVYATGGSNRNSCIESTHIGNIGSYSANNWLSSFASTSGMWTLNHFTGVSGYTLVASTAGEIAPNGLQYTSAVYPVVSLKEDVGFVGGNGTSSKPFKLKYNSTTENYTDYITNVYLNNIGNVINGFAGKMITSFNRDNGALLFSNDTWCIPSNYKIVEVKVYSASGVETATYKKGDLVQDDTYHTRPYNYVFKRRISPDLDYIGNSVLSENDGTLRFVIVVTE